MQSLKTLRGKKPKKKVIISRTTACYADMKSRYKAKRHSDNYQSHSETEQNMALTWDVVSREHMSQMQSTSASVFLACNSCEACTTGSNVYWIPVSCILLSRSHCSRWLKLYLNNIKNRSNMDFKTSIKRHHQNVLCSHVQTSKMQFLVNKFYSLWNALRKYSNYQTQILQSSSAICKNLLEKFQLNEAHLHAL